MDAHILREILLLIIAAFIGGFAARSLSLPPILGYIVSGIVFGAVGKALFPSYSALLDLSQLGITLLLFTLGFEISPAKLKNINKNIIALGVLQVLLCTMVFIPLLAVFNFSLKSSILFSVVFSFSSTAVVIKLLEEKGLLSDFPGNNIFVILLMQDIFVVPVIFFLPILFSKTAITLTDFGLFFVSLLKTVVIFALVFFFSKYFLPKVANIIFKYPSHELNILATIFISVLSIGLLTSIGLPQTIAAFLAGVLISEEGKNLAPLAEIRPLRDILLVLFFVLTGMLLNLSFVFSNLILILVLSVILLFAKFSSIYLLLRFSNFVPSSSVFISSYLTNVGEFAVIIAQFSLLSGYIGEGMYNVLLSVFIFSLIFIPFWTKYFLRAGNFFIHFKFLRKILGDESYSFNNFQVADVENHVIICGHGRVGSQIRSLLDCAGIQYVVVDYNRNIISSLTEKNRMVIYGDPSDDEVLISAKIQKAKVLILAVPDKTTQSRIIRAALELNPKVVIFCRSHLEEDRFDLINLGVNSVVSPEFEAGIKIGTEVLQLFGLPEESVTYLVKKLRKEHLA